MVLQGPGGDAPQVVESLPVEGLTVTAAEADTRQAQARIDANTKKGAGQDVPRAWESLGRPGRRSKFTGGRGPAARRGGGGSE